MCICLPDTKWEKLCSRKCLFTATVQEIKTFQLLRYLFALRVMLFFFPPTCLSKKAVLQGDIILAISSRKLYVTLTYTDMFLWRRLSGSTSTTASDSAVKCCSRTQGVLCSVEGRQVLYRWEVVSSFTVTMSAGRDAIGTFNWVNLKTCRVGMCVYFDRWGIITVWSAHSCTWTKTSLPIPICGNWDLLLFLQFCSRG